MMHPKKYLHHGLLAQHFALNMVRRLPLLLLLLGGALSVAAQATANEVSGTDMATQRLSQPAMILSCCPGDAPFLSPYQPQLVATFEELPPIVAANVRAYLLARVGKSFFETLSFIKGQRISLTREDSMRIGVKNFHWKLAAYYLKFDCLTLRNEDGNSFIAGASFDARGNVVDDVNLPAFSSEKNKFSLISADQAIEIGRSNWGIFKRKRWIKKDALSLVYSPLNDSLAWYFNKEMEEEPGRSHIRRIIIDATSGNILRIRDTTYRYIPF